MAELYEKVKTTLSDSQLAEMRDSMAAKVNQVSAIKDEKRQATSGFNARIKSLEAEILALAQQITDRTLEVEVEIIEVRNDEAHTVSLRSKATGEEVRVRDMSAEEIVAADKRTKQLSLPLEEKLVELKPEPPAELASDEPVIGTIHNQPDGEYCADVADHDWVLCEAKDGGPAEGEIEEPYKLGLRLWYECATLGCKAWAEYVPSAEEQPAAPAEPGIEILPGAVAAEETTELNGQKLVKVDRAPQVPADVPTEPDPDLDSAEPVDVPDDDDDVEAEQDPEDVEDEDEDTDDPAANDLF